MLCKMVCSAIGIVLVTYETVEKRYAKLLTLVLFLFFLHRINQRAAAGSVYILEKKCS